MGKSTTVFKTFGVGLLLILLLGSWGSGGPAAADMPHGNDRLGLCFISSAEGLASETRYSGALATGARWDRWPLYWHWVDQGGYVGTHDGGVPHDYDALVIQEIAHDLMPIAILLGTPDMRATAGSTSVPPPRVQDKIFPPIPGQVAPQQGKVSTAASPPVGLFEPIFADGTDAPAPGKVINQANTWADFVHNTVQRYMPGGTLAAQQGWGSGVGVRHWEIWNEQDLNQFWNGTVQEYYRLLEVAYQTIQATDPRATVILGALAFFEKPDWLSDLLAQTDGDPDKAYFDVFSFHYYWSIYNTEYWLVRTRDTLDAAGLAHAPIWITESGVPVWDDFPATVYNVPPDSPYRGTMEEQATYIIQNAALAFHYDVARYYHFMLHDDCGNTLEDAFGLRHNFAPHACNPAQGKTRPAYTAYQLVAEQFRNLTPIGREKEDDRDRIAFYRPDDGARLMALWATDGVTVTTTISATAATAQLYWIEPLSSTLGITGISRTLTLTPSGGVYTLTLPAATNQNSGIPGDSHYYIGGRPYLLVEIGPDTLPPTSRVEPLPPTSPPTFTVRWAGQDLGSGVASYDVWFNDDGSPLQAWLTATTAIRADWSGVISHTYGFVVRARDHAGNEEALPAAPQASTLVVPGVAASGVVLSADGQPVVDATVTISGTSLLREASSGDGGLWSATLPAGEYAFYANAVEHGVWPTPRYAAVGDSAGITLTLAPLANVVTAGDFEASNVWSVWARPNGTISLTNQAFDGRAAARLGEGAGQLVACLQNGQPGALWTMAQTVDVPLVTAPVLSFVYSISTTQTTFDYAWLEVALRVGGETHYLLPWGQVWQPADWRLMARELSAWRGRRVELLFQAVNCSPASFVATLDRVSVGGAVIHLTERVYLPLILR